MENKCSFDCILTGPNAKISLVNSATSTFKYLEKKNRKNRKNLKTREN